MTDQQLEPKKEVNIRCRRSSDVRQNAVCDAMRAYIVTSPSSTGTMSQYRCVKCSYVWTIALGGSINI